MRVLRPSVACVLTMVLASASAASVAAQPEQEIGTGPEFAVITSVTESDCWDDASQSSWGDGDGYTWFRGMAYGCELESNDPRVSGTLRGTFGDDCFGDPDVNCVFWNSEEIIGPEGAWTGWVWGTHRPTEPGSTMSPSTMTLLKVFTGHGAYEGLSLLMHGLGPMGDLDFNGIVYEGSPPPPLGDLHFAMPSGEPLDEAIEAEPIEEPDGEGAANEQIPNEEPAVADEEEAVAEDGNEGSSGTAVYIDGLRTWQMYDEEDTIYELEMSDPRANGTYTEFDFVGDGYDSESERQSVAALGHVTLVNEKGTWSGLESAVWDDEMGWRLTAWLAGDDAYDGLTLYLHAHRFPTYSTPEMDFDGVIFEGTPPVMLEAVQIPAE